MPTRPSAAPRASLPVDASAFNRALGVSAGGLEMAETSVLFVLGLASGLPTPSGLVCVEARTD